MEKIINQRIPIKSDSSEKTYEICIFDDGSCSCSCPAWLFHKGQRINCKHIKKLKIII